MEVYVWKQITVQMNKRMVGGWMGGWIGGHVCKGVNMLFGEAIGFQQGYQHLPGFVVF